MALSLAIVVEVKGTLAGPGFAVATNGTNCHYVPLSSAVPVSKNKLSMFFGVTVPCILSIFSVILFLRMGYILGQVRWAVGAGRLVCTCAVWGEMTLRRELAYSGDIEYT